MLSIYEKLGFIETDVIHEVNMIIQIKIRLFK